MCTQWGSRYLNFNDLVNADVFGKRLAKWQDKLQPFGTKIHTAMAADVNGFSIGYRDAMIENGVEFFFTNVHCHHGMYPLYQNQNAFFWENASGQRLLVWNGEHYNLGNVLGLQPNHAVNWMMRNRLGEDADAGTFFSDQLHTNLDKYLTECETEGYPYDFIVTAVSGVFSDNAPPSAEIMETIRAYNEKYGQEVRVEMVSLQELYAAIAPKLTDAPVTAVTGRTGGPMVSAVPPMRSSTTRIPTTVGSLQTVWTRMQKHTIRRWQKPCRTT